MDTYTDTQIVEEIFSIISCIRDPEKTHCTLSQLGIVLFQNISYSASDRVIMVYLQPTTPKCHMMQQIGLLIYSKVSEELPNFYRYKLEIKCRDGAHEDPKTVNKLLNDKERVLAALENEEILKFVHRLTHFQ